MHTFDGVKLLTALLVCLGGTKDKRIGEYFRVYEQARALTPQAATELEKRLVEKPDDLDARRLLIEYSSSGSDAAKLFPHYLWMVEHAPGDFIFGRSGSASVMLGMEHGTELKEAWMAQADAPPADVLVLTNAASELRFLDVVLSLELYERAIQIDPKNPDWWAASAHLRLLSAIEGDTVDADGARRALHYFTRAMELQEPDERFYTLEETADAAFLAGDCEKARELAQSLLAMAVESPPSWNYGNAVHHGNLILGHCALRDGSLDEAEKYLLLAGKTPGSPQLNSFGPNMRLALALLQAGRREAVLEYLRRCQRFWKRPQPAEWIKTIENGGTPDFGGNMYY